jgi:HSP20 family protein
MSTEASTLPLRVYETDRRIMVAAPMPGLEPGDIAVHVGGDRVRIHGMERGPHQHERQLLLAQWAIGPYDAEITLTGPVDGALTNATYGNGVLVLVMPKVRRGNQGVTADIRLEAVKATRGERVGHVSRLIRPVTTEEHLGKHRHRVGQA